MIKRCLQLTHGLIIRLYVFLFARPSMQALNNVILQLALRGYGYNNSCHIGPSGEAVFIRMLSKYQPKLCIDVGGNIGDYSKALLALTDAKVIAFEPLPRAFEELCALKALYPNRFTAINQAVGHMVTELDLYFPNEKSGIATLSPEVNQIDCIGAKNTNTIQVSVTTLDAFIAANPHHVSDGIDLIKIDTEGFEYEVLQGASQTIAQHRPKFIQIEYNHHQLFKGQSLLSMAALLPEYEVYQMLPHGRGLVKRDIKRPESNIYHYANFVFVRHDSGIDA